MNMKYAKYLILLVAIIVVFAVLLRYHANQQAPASTTSGADTSAALAINAHLPMETIKIGSTTLRVEVASDDAERQQGLSDRTSLEQGTGMLFVFAPPRAVNFWMKDMQFSLDMVFANTDGVIIKIDTDVTPESYPKLFPSGSPIMYVLEIPAGYAATSGIAVGQKIVVQ